MRFEHGNSRGANDDLKEFYLQSGVIYTQKEGRLHREGLWWQIAPYI